MVNLISERTGTDVKVGQNGVVVVNGAPEEVMKAVKAIKLVEEEAHAADLTSKVESLLGVSSDGQN